MSDDVRKVILDVKKSIRKIPDSSYFHSMLHNLETIIDTMYKRFLEVEKKAKLEEWKKDRLIQKRKMELGESSEGVVHNFVINNSALGTGYLLVSLFSDGSIGALELKMKNDVSEIKESKKSCKDLQLEYIELFVSFHSVLILFFRCITVGLKHGVPMNAYIKEFIHSRFFPDGFTHSTEIPMTTSIIDYLMKYVASYIEYDWKGK